ncbi:MAG TPA: hypothetical protein PLN03_12390 [Spirochaetota bacterium]|nr:hypothetical protein [Spirochaetota bacterium]HOK93606.1 hypothetical protein [Spirochaetota bacterium]HOV09348.1 hypothetical protein [Spirochaetota bacterium]
MKNKESELINTLLKNFLESASMEEIEELYKLLESRKNRFKGMSLNIDTQAMAKAMSESIQEQLGMANLNIKKMARELVAQLAIQHNPDISQDELNAIINHMVPEKRQPVAANLPKDIVMTMVGHFIEGELSSGLEWKKQFWNAFPEDVKIFIAQYLCGEIQREELFKKVSNLYEKDNSQKKDKKDKKKKPMPYPPGPKR